jgi:cell wall-associated NlpC family hydrolase
MTVAPGDLLLTRDSRWWARLIRAGAGLRDQPDSWNHVIVASHTDEAGTFWGVEGRPGGVGWVDLAPWLVDRWTLTNADQPKTEAQRAQVVAVAQGMLGTPYDWAGIVQDAMIAVDAPQLWRLRDFDGRTPAHVVCSSLAAWTYNKAGLPRPPVPRARDVTPADWAAFILTRGWESPTVFSIGKASA